MVLQHYLCLLGPLSFWLLNLRRNYQAVPATLPLSDSELRYLAEKTDQEDRLLSQLSNTGREMPVFTQDARCSI